MIKSIQHFQTEGVKKLEKVFVNYSADMTKIAENSIIIDTAHVDKYTIKYLPISTVYVPGGGNLSSYLSKTIKDEAQTPESMYANLLANASGKIWTSGIATYKDTLGLN